MQLQHLPRTASVEDAVERIREHGYVIIDELASEATMKQIEFELEPYMAASPHGDNDGIGKLTRRTGSLIARSPTVRELAMNELVLGIVRSLLAHASGIQLTFTEVIALSPGSEPQFLHQDELLYDGYPFSEDYEVYVNTLWALSDYTEEMGATRIIPGSHKAGKDAMFEQSDTVAAEMARGSVMVYSGKLRHGSGHNRSDRVRRALDLGYSVAWVRQEENQYLACPPEIARTLPEELLRLMGYQALRGYGHIGRDRNGGDPLTVLNRS